MAVVFHAKRNIRQDAERFISELEREGYLKNSIMSEHVHLSRNGWPAIVLEFSDERDGKIQVDLELKNEAIDKGQKILDRVITEIKPTFYTVPQLYVQLFGRDIYEGRFDFREIERRE